MDQFDELRKQAQARRDRTMAAARDEYSENIASIDRLARLFGGTKTSAYRPLTKVMAECLPHDRAFTIGDVFELLEAREPDRIFPAGSVRTCLCNLAKQGIIKRVGRNEGSILWAVKGFESGNPFGAQTMRQVVGALLRELGPLTLEEIVVHLQSRGYRRDVDPRTVHENIRASLNKRGKGLVRDSTGRWALVS